MSKKTRYFIDNKSSKIADFEDDPDETQAVVTVTDFESLTTNAKICAKSSKERPLGTSWIEISNDQFAAITIRLGLESKRRREASYARTCASEAEVTSGLYYTPGALTTSEAFGYGFLFDPIKTTGGSPGPEPATETQPLEIVKSTDDAISKMKDRIHELQCAAYRAQLEDRSGIIDSLREENIHLREMIDTVRTEYLDTKNLLEIAEEKIRKLTEKKDEGCKLRSA